MSKLIPIIPVYRFVDGDDLPLIGGKVYTYAAGTTTPLTTYSNKELTVPNTNPVQLNLRGEAVIFLPTDVLFDFDVFDVGDTAIETVEDVTNGIANSAPVFYDNDGNPLAGGKLYTYVAGTTTPQSTYADTNGDVTNANPLVLDGTGATEFWVDDAAYKYVLKDSLGNTIWSVDTRIAGEEIPIPTDPYFSQVVLLLHGDGADGGTTFTDSSQYAAAASVNGAAVTDTDQKKYGTASMWFDEAGGYITFPDAAQYTIGTDDFTIEAWVRRDATTSGSDAIIAHGNPVSTLTGWAFYVESAGALFFRWRSGETSYTLYTANFQVPTGQWVHVAVTREAGTLRLFADGNIGIYTTSLGAKISEITDVLFVGEAYGTIGGLKGHIDDLRFTIGTARYTANFTPPDAPFPDAGP